MSPILNIYGQEKPDLVLELEGVDNTKVKQLIINNDTVWNEICPSNQCRIEYTIHFLASLIQNPIFFMHVIILNLI